MNRIHTLLAIGAFALVISGCDKKPESVQEGMQKVQAAAEDMAASTENLAGALGDLTTDKVRLLGEIAAKLETAPAEAKKMLEEHGWTREQFDAAVEKIRNSEHLAKIFDSAKEVAAGH